MEKLKMKIKFFPINLLFLLLSVSALANIAQPGIRNAGGSAGLTLLFPEDSLAMKKVQMQKEYISIQLYKGFAVVKGQYWMKNTSTDSIFMKTGYPLNANYESIKNNSDLTEISFGEIYGLKVIINDADIPFSKKAMAGKITNVYSYSADTIDWFIWNTVFPPNELTKVELYFLVNTNESSIREGYDGQNYNAFIYVLETGSSWLQPIVEGNIQIQLMDEIELKEIKGASPDSIFYYHAKQKTLYYTFQNLSPTNKNNIIITYGDQVQEFDFENILKTKTDYFSVIDLFSKSTQNTIELKPVYFSSPFDIPSLGSATMGIVFYILIFGPVIMGVLLVALIARWWYIRHNRKKKKTV